jgi:hypothetical protein
MKNSNRLLAVLIILGSGLLVSCEAIKRTVCGSATPCRDTVAYVSIQLRDTIPVFKGTKVFVGSSVDSISKYDSMRYYQFELMNYGGVDYAPNDENHLLLIFDLEINGVIYRSDTTVIGPIANGRSRYYTAKYPLKWFMSGRPGTWNYSAIDLPYHYRIAIKDQNWNTKDMFYPRPLNEKLPVKKYDEVTKDTVMYWVRPVVKDTLVTLKRPVYAFKDSLIFIDDMIGCNVYAHTFFGNKIYNFTVDTCLKIICSKELTDDNTETISSLVVKAWSKDADAGMEILVDGTLADVDSYSKSDSLFVCLIAKPFNDIHSVELKSGSEWTVGKAYVNRTQLLGNPDPPITLKGVTEAGGVYKCLATQK